MGEGKGRAAAHPLRASAAPVRCFPRAAPWARAPTPAHPRGLPAAEARMAGFCRTETFRGLYACSAETARWSDPLPSSPTPPPLILWRQCPFPSLRDGPWWVYRCAGFTRLNTRERGLCPRPQTHLSSLHYRHKGTKVSTPKSRTAQTLAFCAVGGSREGVFPPHRTPAPGATAPRCPVLTLSPGLSKVMETCSSGPRCLRLSP